MLLCWPCAVLPLACRRHVLPVLPASAPTWEAGAHHGVHGSTGAHHHGSTPAHHACRCSRQQLTHGSIKQEQVRSAHQQARCRQCAPPAKDSHTRRRSCRARAAGIANSTGRAWRQHPMCTRKQQKHSRRQGLTSRHHHARPHARHSRHAVGVRARHAGHARAPATPAAPSAARPAVPVAVSAACSITQDDDTDDSGNGMSGMCAGRVPDVPRVGTTHSLLCVVWQKPDTHHPGGRHKVDAQSSCSSSNCASAGLKQVQLQEHTHSPSPSTNSSSPSNT